MRIFDTYTSVVIIGNGFDRNCGLKTSYKDVYKQYVLTSSRNVTIDKFKKEISYRSDYWSDFELGMSKYAMTFDSEDGFIECLEDFYLFMHHYLIDIQRSFHEEWKKTKTHNMAISSFTNSINNLGKGISHNIDEILNTNSANIISNIGFISLNYTDIFDTLLKSAYNGVFYHDPIHIHGVLGDDPILGMDRDDQLNIHFAITDRLRRHFIKPFFNNEYDTSRIIMANDCIDQADYIFVYGASLGESDLSWREKLLSWLCNNDDHHLFLYFYDNEEINSSSRATIIDYENDQKRSIISKWGLTPNEVPDKRLHLPCGIKLFKMEEALRSDINRNNMRV